MRLYTGLWVFNAFFLAFDAALDTFIKTKGKDSVSSGMLVLHSVIASVAYIVQACLETLILWTYLRFSSKIEEQLVADALG